MRDSIDSTPIDNSPLVYSYVRFSSAEQSKGDSLRRQLAATEAWCAKMGFRLDTSLRLHDLGVSAFRGKHRDDKFALGQFLRLVERGRVPRGSYLVIENLDRLSREHERAALRLWMDILDNGVHIVTLTPETIYRHKKSDMIDIMRAILEISRGHNESAVKSERIGKAWAEKKRRGREEGQTITHKLPGWIEVRDGKRCLKPGAKAAIKRIHQLMTSGYGERRAVRVLNREGVPCFGRNGKWRESYLRKLVRDRRLIGEFQPRIKATGEPDGEPIKDYFPAVLTEAEFYAMRRDRAARRSVRKGTSPAELQTIANLHQQGKGVTVIARMLGVSRNQIYRALATLNVRKQTEGKPQTAYIFARMVQSFRGQKYSVETWLSGGRKYRVFMLKGDQYATFPYYVFEMAMLHELNEIDPQKVLGENGHDTLRELEDEYNAIDAEIAEINDFMDRRGFSETLGLRAKKLDDRRKEVAARLKEAADKAANPLSASWAEAQGLIAALDATADKDDARLRLRAALRRIIKSIRMAVLVGPGRNRIALVDIEFAGEHAGRFRSINIWYRPSPNGGWAVASAAGHGEPVECLPREEHDDPPGGNIVGVADWYQQLPAEPREWFPLPE